MEVIRNSLEELTNTVSRLGSPSHSERAERRRVALVAVRSELATAATIITEAREKGEWFNPTHDPLPADEWAKRMADLADRELPTTLHERIERAYQRCNRLNQRIVGYRTDYRDQHPLAVLATTKTTYPVSEEDEAELRKAIRSINDANTAITTYLETDA